MIKDTKVVKQCLMANLLLSFSVFPVASQAQENVETFSPVAEHNEGHHHDRRCGHGHPGKKLKKLVKALDLKPATGAEFNVPSVNDPMVQLGKELFYAKNLGGDQDVACVSCHHPSLGGADALSLSVGINPVNAQGESSHALLGVGRFNGNGDLPNVPRNAPTAFNTVLNVEAMFWAGRIEFDADGELYTVDSERDADGNRLPDTNFPYGTSIASVQARFPPTAGNEMRGGFFPDADRQTVRDMYLPRFNNTDPSFVSSWPTAFALAYGDAEMTFNRIADAIGAYEDSMLFVNSPWKAYLEGDEYALTRKQKAGAVLFFTSKEEGGAGCSGCHQGTTLSGPEYHLVAFSQFGPGKGNPSGTSTSTDYGREIFSGEEADRFHFRPPSLLNVEVTAPYGHVGIYQKLEEVVGHYGNPRKSINKLFGAKRGVPFVKNAPFCRLPQVKALTAKNQQSCESMYPNAYANSIEVVTHLEQANDSDSGVEATNPLHGIKKLSRREVKQVTAFLTALTDPCVKSRECLAPWIIDGNDSAAFPDDKPLVGVDAMGHEL
ncbi:MAG: cytochrome c peroxidase [Phenylobacterium sp.]|jgi:cytochrome c peroxidase